MVGHQLATFTTLEDELELITACLDLHRFLIGAAGHLVQVLTGIAVDQWDTGRFYGGRGLVGREYGGQSGQRHEKRAFCHDDVLAQEALPGMCHQNNSLPVACPCAG
ncbi:hypothetical protein D3C78_1376290 [compost metagenome]